MDRRVSIIRLFLTAALVAVVAVPLALTGVGADIGVPEVNAAASSPSTTSAEVGRGGDDDNASDERPGLHRYRGFIDVAAQMGLGRPTVNINDQTGEGTFFDVVNATAIVFEMTWASVDPVFGSERVPLHLDIDHPAGHDVDMGTGTGSNSDPLTFVYDDPKPGQWHAVATADDAAAQQEYHIYVSIFRAGQPPADYTVFDYF